MSNSKEGKNTSEDFITEIYSLIQGSVESFLRTQETLWTSTQEVIEIINKEYWLSLTTQDLTSEYNKSAAEITEKIIINLNEWREKLGDDIFVRVCANIYLTMIDKNWIDHIDEMQYLREKVWLVGYAQLDPLVIYKKEAYAKYQALNTMINQSTVSVLSNTDFNQIDENIKAQKQQQLDILQEQQNNSNNDILAKLKSAAQDAPKNTQQQPRTNKPWTSTTVNNDGFEIIETNGNTTWETTQSQQTFTIQKSNKLRPNDKVTVRYSDGKIEFDVKYKKVSEDIKTGKAEII